MLSPQHEEAKSKRCPPDIGSSALPSPPMPLARADQVIEEGCCLLHCMSPVVMLWTAPPPGARAPKMWALLRLPRFGGASYAHGYDNRSGHCEVGLSGSWR